MPDPWAEFHDAHAPAKADPWAEFDDAREKATQVSRKPAQAKELLSTSEARPTGDAHDGDTIHLTDGANARLYGYDAFELDQQGMFRDGLRPIGREARSALLPELPGGSISYTGRQSYGRPVVTLDQNGNDVARDMLDEGWGLAAPEYLRADPSRLHDYMEAERLSRLNRRGAHAGRFQSPEDYRKGKPDPWAAPEEGSYGNGIPVFFDEPTPFQGLRPEIEKGYLQIWADPNSTAEQLLAYAKENGFTIDPDETRKVYAERAKGRSIDASKVRYAEPPRLLTDAGDGALGAGLRGLADPINMLDEMGGIVDTLGGTSGRENVWNSDRRFGDILSNNISQNRSILEYDDASHPYARFGGQLASGLIAPGLSIEGVGLSAARQALKTGATRYEAMELAKTAVRRRLSVAGSAEGAAAGFGAGEGWQDRAEKSAMGAVAGALFGYGSGALGQEILPRLSRRLAKDAGDVSAKADEWEEFQPAPADHPAVMAMENEAATPPPSVSSPRQPDIIDVNAVRARAMSDAPSEAQLNAASERINPSDILPIPSNEVGSIHEAAGIEAGRYAPVRAVDENSVLQSRALPSPVDASRTLPKRGPLDLATWLRTQGGVQDQGGELSHLGIDNKGRDLDFARGEARFGNIVASNGMTLDQAADAAWRAGYFPQHSQRPTIPEFLDALDNTQRGTVRAFRPDDLAEVDAFNAARDQRYAVEKARQEGAPLVEDRSLPANETDVAGNQPPVSAYEEWPDGGPDFAGNIRLSNLETPQDIKRALVQTHNRVGFDAATRGRVSHAETERLASELGMTPDQLLSRRKGQALNAEEALAARQILAKSGNELVNLARRVQRMDDPGEEVLAAFRQAWVRHVAIQEQVAGMTAEAGRTLQQFRMIADGRAVRGNILNALSEGGGGKDRLKGAADLILEHADNPAGMNRAAAKALQPKFLDKINELWINSLLSGPQTHVVNAVSNTMTSLAQIPEHAVAAGLGGARNLILRRNVTDRVLFSELGARSVGLMQGVREGLRQAARTARTGEGSDFANKVEARTQDAISGVKGTIIRTPTRMLSAADELYKAMARRMELSGLAVRKAAAEGLKGQEGRKRVAELLANPTDEMLEKAFDYGGYVTFQRPLSGAMQGLSRFTQNMPGMKFILPFIRTPTNLLKFSLERSPAAPLIDTWRADFRAGGARRDLAVARAMVGTGVGALIMEMAAKGDITGNGPADAKAKQLMMADGWQPYSIRIGDKYYSYSRLDPFATTLGVAAGMVDLQDHMTERQKDEVALLLTASIMQNLSSKTWLSGIGDMVQAVDDPARYADNWWQRFAGSAVVPAGVAQIARSADPTLRKAESTLDAIRARVPGLSKSLESKRDIWGQPITREGGVGPDLISPAYVSTAKGDPVNKALLDADVHVSKPQRKWQGRSLSAKDYGSYQELAGALGKAAVQALVSSPEWSDMDQEERQDAINETMRHARKQARDNLPEIFGSSGAEP